MQQHSLILTWRKILANNNRSSLFCRIVSDKNVTNVDTSAEFQNVCGKSTKLRSTRCNDGQRQRRRNDTGTDVIKRSFRGSFTLATVPAKLSLKPSYGQA